MVSLKGVDVVDAQPYVGRSCREAIETLPVVDDEDDKTGDMVQT